MGWDGGIGTQLCLAPAKNGGAPGLIGRAGFPRAEVQASTTPRSAKAMALDQLRQFLARMQEEPALRARVLAAATADDVAQIAAGVGFSFSGDELLRFSGQKVGRVTVSKQDLPGEYN
jgi:predicted ribosomally synthesized peptide with nif11-like leader